MDPKAPPTNPRSIKVPIYHSPKISSVPANLGLPANLKYNNAILAIPIKVPTTVPCIIPDLIVLLTRYPVSIPPISGAKYIPKYGIKYPKYASIKIIKAAMNPIPIFF